jgi:hypothetical protein
MYLTGLYTECGTLPRFGIQAWSREHTLIMRQAL